MESKGITCQLDKNSVKSNANKINLDLYNNDNARDVLVNEQSTTRLSSTNKSEDGMALPPQKLYNFFIYQSDIPYPANQDFLEISLLFKKFV
uniref:Uncharacterized protein n=1 Tax=Glossina austeni TaxID=7395 RepID=A0A1A9VDX4_GLOAU